MNSYFRWSMNILVRATYDVRRTHGRRCATVRMCSIYLCFIIRDYLPALILHGFFHALDLFTVEQNLFWNRKRIFEWQ